MPTRIVFAHLGILAFLFSFPGIALSQPVWLNQDHNSTVAIEFLKPDFRRGTEATFSTMAVFMTFRYELENVSLVTEVPFVHYGSRFRESQNSVGNLYLGFEGKRKGAFGEFGIRVPTSSENNSSALAVGLISDLDRWEAFLPKTVAIMGWFNYRTAPETGFG